jgi:hypothetical protein
MVRAITILAPRNEVPARRPVIVLGQTDHVSHNVRVVFVFSRDEELIVFPSLKDAAGWMEAIDVDHGEYPAVLALNGVSSPSAPRAIESCSM